MTKISLATQMRVKKNAARAAGKKPDVDAIKSKAKQSAEAMNAEMTAEPTKDSKRTVRRMLRKAAKMAAVDALKGVNAAGMDVEKLSGLAARAAVAAVRALQDAVEVKGNRETQKPTSG
jgi:glutamine synthetase adenylyltransferase